jgi:O-antigen ligase
MMDRQIPALAPRLFPGLRSRGWLRLLVVAAVLLGSLAPLLANPTYMLIGLAGVVVGGVGLAVMLRWPEVGIAAVMVLNMTVDYGLPTGTGTRLPPGLFLIPVLVVLWTGEILTRRAPAPRFSRPEVALLVFLFACLVAYGVGQLVWFPSAQKAPWSAQLGGLAVFFLSGSLFLLVGQRLRSPVWLEKYVWLFLALGAAYVVTALFPAVGRTVSGLLPGGAAGSLFWAWLVALSAGLALFHRNLRPIVRVGLLAMTAAVFYVNLFEGRRWASGWIPALVALLAVIWVGRPKVAAAISVPLLIGTIVFYPQITDVLLEGDNAFSLSTRLEAWRILAEIVRVNPILGLGPANYYYYTPNYSILGFSVSFNSHNNYVDLVAQIGLFGTATFVWFAAEMTALGLRLRRHAPDGFPLAFVAGVLGGLAGTLVAGGLGDWILPFVYNIGMDGMRSSLIGWMFLGGLVAFASFAGRGVPSSDPSLSSSPAAG